MRWIIYLIVVVIFLDYAAPAQERVWVWEVFQLQLLKSNYRDVRTVLHLDILSPQVTKDSDGELWRVDSDEGQWELFFTRRDMCKEGPQHYGPAWNVPAGTLREINFYPNQSAKISLNELPFPVSDPIIFHINRRELYVYTNEKNGVGIGTDREGTVGSINLKPPPYMSYFLCGEQ